MNWSLINEIGIDDSLGEALDAPQQLQFPTFVARAADGSYLIADELGKEKLVPFRFESRTMRIDSSGEVLLDTTAVGISDGVGCLGDDGTMAILCRTKWELLLLSDQGTISVRIPLATMSKRMPRIVSATGNGTWIVSFSNHAGDLDLVEVDSGGRMCWFLSLLREQIGIAGSIQWTPSDTCLIADPLRHVVFEIDRTGKVVWQFGEPGNPSADICHLSSPFSARALPDGSRLVADARNHRILVIAPDGTPRRLEIQDTGLCDPMYADMLDNGHYLICDTGNTRVVELDSEGRVLWHYGSDTGTEPLLSYPRSVEIIDSARYLVADTAHDRIIEIENGTVTERAYHGRSPLFWPRCARSLASGGLIVADGRNGRVVEVAKDGTLMNELTEIDLDGPHALGDPHDVHVLPNGNLLIVDSMHDLVVEADWSGRVHRAVGAGKEPKLSDPHSAQVLKDGSILIADTGNHRILIVGRDGDCIGQLDSIQSDRSHFRLHTPRYVESIEDGTMVIADTGNNRVLTTTLDGRLIWEFSRVPGSHPNRLNQPRWASLISRYEVLVCDHFHHRILHVKWDGAEGGLCQDVV